MALQTQTFFGVEDKVALSIETLRTFEPAEGYYLAFSGGKDSVAVKALCDMAGVKYDAHYSVTSVDPPELVQFIKEYHKDVIRDIPLVYVLCNFDSTFAEDLERVYTIRDLGYSPYIMLYDKANIPNGSEYKRLQRWVNNRFIFRSVERFEDYGGAK